MDEPSSSRQGKLIGGKPALEKDPARGNRENTVKNQKGSNPTGILL